MKESKTIKGKIAAIETAGMVDGPGVRTVVFLQGCPLRCVYCHNPEMQEKISNEAKDYLPSEILGILKRYKSYYKNNGGVTFSGGEPLFQSEFLAECLKLCKKEGICTALDTSGIGTNYNEVLDNVDLVILDIKACNTKEFKEITGGNFKQFEEFLKTCQKMKKRLLLRTVVVPGINDNEEHIKNLARYIGKIKYVDKIELLPYHDMAKKKYAALNRAYPLEGVAQMDGDRCKKLEDNLRKYIKEEGAK